MPEPLVALDCVWRTFKVKGRTIAAVDGFSLAMREGEVVCLVGESGCGKTTVGKVLVGLLPPTSGRVLFRGRDVRAMNRRERAGYRLALQLIHQDPFASLNPTQRVSDILAAPLRRHRIERGRAAIEARLRRIMETVDLTPPDDLLAKFPHQLSGGQRQRVSIARALTVQPSVVVADEAVSMVDVSIRVSLLNTLRRLRDEMGLAVLFITHDLALARYFAGPGRIGVMYLGSLVEVAPAADLVTHPRHPYSRALLAAVPRDPSRSQGPRPAIELRSMDVPSLLARPSGCPFHPRCPLFEPGHCDVEKPDLRPLVTGAEVACHPVYRELGAGAPAITTDPVDAGMQQAGASSAASSTHPAREPLVVPLSTGLSRLGQRDRYQSPERRPGRE